MLNRIRGLGATLLLGYAALVTTDYRCTLGQSRAEVPPSVRTSPGGYRSWSFWHSGEHGGK